MPDSPNITTESPFLICSDKFLNKNFFEFGYLKPKFLMSIVLKSNFLLKGLILFLSVFFK